MPVPFGFSVGDCMSVCFLVKDCIVALDSSRGSAAEYQEVIRELRALDHALSEVLSLAEGFETTPELNALAWSAKRVTDQCRGCIEGFLGRVKRYEKSLGTGSSGYRLRDVKGKLGWALFMKDDLANFRAEINAQSSTINMLLITASLSCTKLNDKNMRERLEENEQGLQQRLEDTEHTNDERGGEQLMLLGQLKHTLCEHTRSLEVQGNTTTRLAERMKYFISLGAELKAFMWRIWKLNWRSYNILLDLQTRVPREFGPCWIQEPLILTDAIGRVAPVHLEFVNSWEVLESALAARFRNIPGERKIKQKEYALQDRSSLRDLKRNTPFEACFMPGGHVDMAMIFQGTQGRGNYCPGCGKESEGMQSVAVICTGCGIWYQRVEEIVEENLDEPIDVETYLNAKPTGIRQADQISSSPSRSWAPAPISKKRKADNSDTLEAMSMFKRVRLMQRAYQDRNHGSNSTDIAILSMTSLVKGQRVFEWVSETLFHSEYIYDQRRQTEFSKSLDKTQALHFASFHGDSSIVQDLLNQGVDVNKYEYWHRSTDSGKIYDLPFTALEAAASGAHRYIVKLLLMHGANPCIGQAVWGTPLVIAARKHDSELARTLLDCGADVNQRSVYSYSSGQTMTALQRACCEGDLEMVTLLLNRGADVNAPSGHYGPALVAATISENPLLVDQLLGSGADINAVHRIGPKANSGRRQQTALVRAISNNHLSVVRLLLDRGADIYVECECGNAVQNAAFFGREEIIDELILRGADVYRPSKSFNTVLEAATAGSQHKLFKKMVAFGMNIYAPCAGGLSSNLLYVAAKSGAYEIVECLLRKGMDVNIRGGWHGCALTAAASGGHWVTSRLLIENGASFAILSHDGTSSLQAAVRYGHCEVVQLLLDAGAPVDVIEGKYGSLLQWAALNTPESVVHLLLDRGIDVNLQGGYFGNALQAWSYVGNDYIVKTLLEKGANPIACGGFYDTAMNAAIHEGHLSVIKLLHEHGAPLPPAADIFNVADDADQAVEAED